MVAGAIGFLLLALVVGTVGTSLWLGEWLFGSLGWGLVHGLVASVAAAVALLALALGVSGRRVVERLVLAVACAVLVGGALALDGPSQLWEAVARAVASGLDPAWRRPGVAGAVVGLGGALVAVATARGRRQRAQRGGVGLVVGAALGGLSALPVSPAVGWAVAITLGWGLWGATLAVALVRRGLEGADLRRRFWPATTVATLRETGGWLQDRLASWSRLRPGSR